MAAAALVPTARASDVRLLAAVQRQLPHVEAVAQAAPTRDGAQAQYDAARDLVESVRAARPWSAGCTPLARAALSYGQAVVAGAEAVDRLERAGAGPARAALRSVAAARARCTPGAAAPPPRAAVLVDPLSGEAFTGRVVARVPRGADGAELRVDGRVEGSFGASGRLVTARVEGDPRPLRRVEVRFFRQGRPLGSAIARELWLLPAQAYARPAARLHEDAPASARLAAAAARFAGYSAVWLEDLRGGRFAVWNADALFPAASTVKVGVLVAALERAGEPLASPLFYDLRALTAWSSNLAANRLLRVLGVGAVGRALRRLGARASTYPGDYRVGTAYRPAQPPRISGRVTTARDLAAIMRSLAAAAAGARSVGLSPHEARVALALLLSSRPRGDNVGLLRPALGPALPVAQKNGWFSAVRHTAAIVFGARGPAIVVVLTFRDGLQLAAAQALGTDVVRVARRYLR